VTMTWPLVHETSVATPSGHNALPVSDPRARESAARRPARPAGIEQVDDQLALTESSCLNMMPIKLPIHNATHLKRSASCKGAIIHWLLLRLSSTKTKV